MIIIQGMNNLQRAFIPRARGQVVAEALSQFPVVIVTGALDEVQRAPNIMVAISCSSCSERFA
jgi:hypothetical protein